MATRKVTQQQKVLNFLTQGKSLSNAVATHKLKVNRLPAKINVLRAQGYPIYTCLLYTSPSPRDRTRSRMPSSA